jgi:hypothetical protein
MRMARRLFVAGLVSAMTGAGPLFAQTLGEVEVRPTVEYGRHDGEPLLGDAYMPKAAGAYPQLAALAALGARPSPMAARTIPAPPSAPG